MKEMNNPKPRSMKASLNFRVVIHLVTLFFALSAYSQQNGEMILSGTWKVTWTDGVHGRDIRTITRFEAEKDLDRYMDVPVPMDLNKAMEAKGMIDDPNIAANSLQARWIGQQFWCYYRMFDVSEETLKDRAWLVFDRLDYAATILLNGKIIGTHKNAYTPCRIDVTGLLKSGINTLSVGIESGYYDAANKSSEDYIQGEIIEFATKRNWMRKPQYQYGWDWNPVMVNVGITGDVRLEWAKHARIDQGLVQASLSDDLSLAELTVNVFVQGVGTDVKATIRSTVIETNQTIDQEVSLGKEVKKFTNQLEVTRPKLWWPIGQGGQNFYHIKTEVIVGGTVVDSGTKRIGIRKLEIDQSPHPEEGKYFTLKVNNRKIFCKGGNWVPADMIYSAVTKEKYETLVNLAKEANFNMLRIWGGGEYISHELLELCDEAGIMVWQDFMFACAKYPGNDREFANNVRDEMTWAVREYSSHPSLCVWCGRFLHTWCPLLPALHKYYPLNLQSVYHYRRYSTIQHRLSLWDT